MRYLMLLALGMAAPAAADQGTPADTAAKARAAAEEGPGLGNSAGSGAAKLLGVIAALVVLRYVMRAAGKAKAPAGERAQQEPGGEA